MKITGRRYGLNLRRREADTSKGTRGKIITEPLKLHQPCGYGG
jgi:hypothetical protein